VAPAAARSAGRPPWAASRANHMDWAQKPAGGIWPGRRHNKVVIKDTWMIFARDGAGG
jgi:hypothetical protein